MHKSQLWHMSCQPQKHRTSGHQWNVSKLTYPGARPSCSAVLMKVEPKTPARRSHCASSARSSSCTPGWGELVRANALPLATVGSSAFKQQLL
eukprot:3539163-Prymnesium_polylepis.1